MFGGVSLSGVTSGSPTGSAFGMESNGRSVLFQGTADEVKNNEQVIESYLGRRTIIEKEKN